MPTGPSGRNRAKPQKNSGIVKNDSAVEIVVRITDSARSARAMSTKTFEKPPLGHAAMSRVPNNSASSTGNLKSTTTPTSERAIQGNANEWINVPSSGNLGWRRTSENCEASRSNPTDTMVKNTTRGNTISWTLISISCTSHERH